MGDTNYIGGIVKVLETPKQKILKNNVPFTEFRVQFPQVRGNKIINLVFWGKLASEVVNYYQANDYIIIEGYLSIVKKQSLKKVEVTVFKVFTFVLG
jgi:single-stranded DNA-binding protein